MRHAGSRSSTPLAPPLPGGQSIESLLRGAQFFSPGMATPDHREVHRRGGREADAPVMYQVHASAAWAIFAIWPFSRLVHAWSYPLWYLWRPYIVIRHRIAIPAKESGTGGRKWRKVGAR